MDSVPKSPGCRLEMDLGCEDECGHRDKLQVHDGGSHVRRLVEEDARQQDGHVGVRI